MNLIKFDHLTFKVTLLPLLLFFPFQEKSEKTVFGLPRMVYKSSKASFVGSINEIIGIK